MSPTIHQVPLIVPVPSEQMQFHNRSAAMAGSRDFWRWQVPHLANVMLFLMQIIAGFSSFATGPSTVHFAAFGLGAFGTVGNVAIWQTLQQVYSKDHTELIEERYARKRMVTAVAVVVGSLLFVLEVILFRAYVWLVTTSPDVTGWLRPIIVLLACTSQLVIAYFDIMKLIGEWRLVKEALDLDGTDFHDHGALAGQERYRDDEGYGSEGCPSPI